jgi:uncharacterized protein YqfA (UPF0365 family)
MFIDPMFLVAIVGAVFVLFVWLIPVRLWVAALASGVAIGPMAFIGMRLRNVSPRAIMPPLITCRKAGLDITATQIQSHYMAGGNVQNVVRGLISANRAKMPLTFQQAREIDLAGRNVSEAVANTVAPKVIDAPAASSGRQWFDAVAKDGIQLKVKARITVRVNLERLVGGATEETVIARVGEGIVSGIGSAATYKEVLKQPDIITRRLLERGLDSGTAFDILSIDIADIDVGKNVGANLQVSQAQADKEIAQARAEEKRSMAAAREQEMRALEEQMRAQVEEARAEVPRAMAEAFRTGALHLMDYYNLKNIMADTEMRDAIADSQGRQKDGADGLRI